MSTLSAIGTMHGNPLEMQSVKLDEISVSTKVVVSDLKFASSVAYTFPALLKIALDNTTSSLSILISHEKSSDPPNGTSSKFLEQNIGTEIEVPSKEVRLESIL